MNIRTTTESGSIKHSELLSEVYCATHYPALYVWPRVGIN